MASLSARATEDSIEKLAQDPRCVRALGWIEKNSEWLTSEQIRVNEIPAPEFAEGPRGAYLGKAFESAGLKVRTDKTGNVIAERPGSDPKSVLLITAHLDTVFPAGTNVRVKRNGSRLEAPGIADNGAGLAAVIGLARALEQSGIATKKTIVLAADVRRRRGRQSSGYPRARG